jgi:type II secretory pathway pseudopilin PulG
VSRLRRGDAGTTLPELLVVMVLMSIVGVLVVTWAIGTQRSAAGFTSRVDDQAELRTAMAHLTRDLRMAIRPSSGVPAFQPASTASDVRFYVNRASGAPLLVRYAVVTAGGRTQLIREETPGVGARAPWTWPTGGTRRTTLVRSLLATAPLNTYFDLSSAELTPCAEDPATPCAMPMAASPTLATPDEVGAVEVRLTARSRPEFPGSSVLRTRVRIANAGLTAIDL